jgi:hypothetical protein
MTQTSPMPEVLQRNTIEITIPASLPYVRIVRLAAGGVASRLGLDIDEIDDLRIGVDELASVLVERSDGSRLNVVLEVTDDAIHVSGSVPRGPLATGDALPELSEQILSVVLDHHEFGSVGNDLTFRCRKHIWS